MKILFDTNIVLDLMLDRKPFSISAAHLFSKVENGQLTGFLGATTITTIFYIASKSIGKIQAQDEIHKLLVLFDIAPVNRVVLENALKSGISDFEDAVLYESAKFVNATGIVTRNTSDFKGVILKIYTPEDLLFELQNS